MIIDVNIYLSKISLNIAGKFGKSTMIANYGEYQEFSFTGNKPVVVAGITYNF